MPSRKKAKGKARRAAKEAKAAVEEEEADEQAALVINQDRSLEAQMQRLTIDDLLRESDAVQCRHGLEKLESGEEQLCEAFMWEFLEAYGKSIIAGDNNMMVNFNAGTEATKEQFASVWKDAEKLRTMWRRVRNMFSIDVMITPVLLPTLPTSLKK